MPSPALSASEAQRPDVKHPDAQHQDVQRWQPTTFRERGVAVPFTSPALAGARIRLLERRPDLIVPHPGGVRGVYVFALNSLAEFCVPTLHDCRLAARLAALPGFSPGSVREAAGAVAAEGAAGRAAAAAAAAAALAHRQRETAYLQAFIAALQADPLHTNGKGSGQQAVEQLARRTGRAPEAVMADISLLAAALAASAQDGPAGAGTLPRPGRARALLAAIADVAAQIEAWSNQGRNDQAASQVVAAAFTMHKAGGQVLAAGGKALTDLAALLSGWALSQAGVTALIGQVDWLLDGWEHICLLWRVSESDEERAAALAEAALVMPPIPAEAEPWFAADPGLWARLGALPHTGAAASAGARELGQAVALTARNERVRGLAA